MKKSGGWTRADKAVQSWVYRTGTEPDRMTMLNQIWEREVGSFARHWVLDGVKRGILYVKVSSPAAAQELQLRSTQVVKSLNKHFRRAWIKSIRPTRGQ